MYTWPKAYKNKGLGRWFSPWSFRCAGRIPIFSRNLMCGSLLPEYRDAEAGGFLQESGQLVQVNLCTLGSRRNPASKQNQTRYRVTEQNTCCQPLASKHMCTSTHINVYAQEHIHKLMPTPTHTRKTPKHTLHKLNEVQPYQHSHVSGLG